MEYNKEILRKLNNIIIQHSNINFLINEDIRNKNLFSREINISPRELVLVFIDIQNEFNIIIPEVELINKKFNTFNDLVHIIERRVDDNG